MDIEITHMESMRLYVYYDYLVLPKFLLLELDLQMQGVNLQMQGVNLCIPGM